MCDVRDILKIHFAINTSKRLILSSGTSYESFHCVQLGKHIALSENDPEQSDLVAENNQDVPREIQSGEIEKEELRKRMIYGAESDRVLHLAPSQLRFYLIKLLSLINAFCYPILALLTIRLQLLYYRYSWH